MQQRRVVPDHDVADAVLEAVPVLRLRRVRGELVEQVARLVVGHADDAERAARHRVERLAPGHRMRPRDPVRDQRHLRLLLVGERRCRGAARLVGVVAVAVVMDAVRAARSASSSPPAGRRTPPAGWRTACRRRPSAPRSNRASSPAPAPADTSSRCGSTSPRPAGPVGLPSFFTLDRIRMFGSSG